MKSYFTIFILTVLFLVSTFSVSFAQTGWTKYEGNPVLDPGPSGAWDAGLSFAPSVLFDGNTYHMWYWGYNLRSIGYATSPNGITWTKYDNSLTTSPPYAESDPVLTPGQPEAWDDASVATPSVLLIDTTYHMWYAGTQDPTHYELISIGHATSKDGINWEKDTLNNPVLTAGTAGNWDDVYLFAPCVIFDGSIYHMWFNGWNGIGNQVRIGHATSPHPDSSWTKDPNNPVLSFEAGRWDYPRVDRASVIYNGNTYHMWYSGGDFFTWRIGYATSPDGSSWTKYAGNPVLNWGSAGSWDDMLVGWCSVLFDNADSTLKMWYTGGNDILDGHIGYATAPAIINVPDDFETIQAAIDAASDGNMVLVDEGTYYENINFKGKAITVASQFYMDGDTSHISNTIIDGSQPSNADSGSVVYFVSGEDTTSVLCGFTITNGSGTKDQYTFEGTAYEGRLGGGIFCWNSGGRFVSNKIINNIISDELNVFGGGIAAGDFGSNAWIILEKNHIINNKISGGFATGGGVTLVCNGKLVENVISYNSSIATETEANAGGVRTATESIFPRTVIIEGNEITHNFVQGKGTESPYYWAARGGGIFNTYSKVLVLNNEISYNQLTETETGTGSGGGIYMWLANNASVVSGNKFFHNKIDMAMTNYGGGMSLASCDVPVYNNIVSGNSAMYGGGLYFTYSNSEVINNTIVNNTGITRGGGLLTEVANPVIINTILWENEAPSGSQIYGSGNVLYSDIQGGWSGEGNINADPLFLDTLSYNLSDLSPCVGTGIDSVQIAGTWYYCPATDISGRQRPDAVDLLVDMGAHESIFPNGIDKEDSDFLLTSFSLKQNYPNPFNPATVISYQLPVISNVEVGIFNLLGQKVVTLVSEKQKAGYHQVEWNASGFASGIYYYQITAGEFQDVKKMILIK